MNLNVYLFFNGNCEEAMHFYSDHLGATTEMVQRYSDAPGSASESYGPKIMHALLHVGGTKLMMSDANEKRNVNVGDNFSISMDFESDGDMKRTFEALSGNGGQVTMPLQDTFWGARFGMCVDKFGINWMFNHQLKK
jgi:PhnB protein